MIHATLIPVSPSVSAETGFNMPAQAERAAAVAAARAGVEVTSVVAIEELRAASALLESVWGRTPEGVPAPSEMLRSMVHADGLVSAAHTPDGGLVGVAVLGRAAPGGCYSYVAAVRPGRADSGTGFALKQHQRAWALGEGMTRMRWTFDPLVSRNARFNLTKLGATAAVYERGFYGQMSDVVNGADIADRLVAEWQLASASAVAASEGTRRPEPEEPDLGSAAGVENGPDGAPAWVPGTDRAWCRVPDDIVALRRLRPAEATAWRQAVARWLGPALDSGLVATSAGRSGWYRLERTHP